MEEMTNLTPNEETPDTVEENAVTEEVSSVEETSVAKETPVAEETPVIEEPVTEVPVTEVPVTETVTPEVVYAATPEVAETPKKKNLVPLFVGLGIAILVIVAAIVIAVNRNYLYAKIAPEAYSIKAAEKTLSTFEDRLDKTPFGVVSDLNDALINGSVGVGAELSTDVDGVEESINVDFEAARNIESNENKLYLSLDYMGISADITAFANDSRLIFFSSLFDDEYGMNYDNLASRLNDKFDLGMSDEEIQIYQDELDAAKAQSDFNIMDYEKSFLSLRDKFLETMKPEVLYEKTNLQGEEVKCIAVKYTVEKEDAVGLLNEYLEIIKNDEAIKEAINLYPNEFGYSSYDDEEEYTSAYEGYLAELEKMVADFEKEYNGTVHIDLYSNTSGSLVKVLVYGDVSIYDEYFEETKTGYYYTVLDLGKKPEKSDRATFVVHANETGTPENEPAVLTLGYIENENSDSKYSSEIMMSVLEESYYDDEETYFETINFVTDYDKSTEEITCKASYESELNEEYGYEPEDFSFKGKLNRNADGSKLEFNDIIVDEYSDVRLDLDINISKKADVVAPEDYKELDDWTEEDIENMTSGLENFIMKLVYGNQDF
ncbi:MAG: hypothetical protein IJY83_02520 [Oscillospiraceae bacterium]|nr:hypothetical protein [Oscillospiraceae bacterium]